MIIVAATFLILIGILALALQRLYSSVPVRELKRLATRGDHLAAALYRPVAYGASMRLLLWIVFGVSLASGFLLVAYNTSGWLAFAAIVLSMAMVVWLLSVRLTVHSVRLAAWSAPVLHKIMQYAHPVLGKITRFVNNYRQHSFHSGLYEKEDLISLLRQQKDQTDNRIGAEVLARIERAAGLDDMRAADITLPWGKVKHVKDSESIGPVLLGELHDSGQNIFTVYKDKPDNVVGTLSLHDAMQAKKGGRVRDVMKPNICYAHEDFSLHRVLSVFASSGHSVIVVVNEFEEAVGVITLRHVIEQLLGQASEADVAFEDRKAVAAWRPQPQPQFAEEPVVDEKPQPPSSEQTEVIE